MDYNWSMFVYIDSQEVQQNNIKFNERKAHRILIRFHKLTSRQLNLLSDGRIRHLREVVAKFFHREMNTIEIRLAKKKKMHNLLLYLGEQHLRKHLDIFLEIKKI